MTLADAQYEWNPMGWSPRGETREGACVVYSRSAYIQARASGYLPHPPMHLWNMVGRHRPFSDNEPTEDQQVLTMFVNFHTLVVRDGLDPQLVHREFLKVDEYRQQIARDCEGAA
jgi:hypothetical protein